jgi:hypothetical protein
MVTSLFDWREGRDIRPLSELDWKVVDSARNDGPRSLNPNGMIASLLWIVFGIATPLGLANDKLEALRRFSVRAWYWDFIRSKDVRNLFEAGYSRTNVLEILSRVGIARGFTPSVRDEFERIAPHKQSSICRCG